MHTWNAPARFVISKGKSRCDLRGQPERWIVRIDIGPLAIMDSFVTYVRERTSAPGTSDGRYVHLNESVTGQTLCPSRRYTISSRGTCPTGDPQGGTAVHMARSVVTGVLLVPDTHRLFPRGDEISSTICTEPGVDDFRAVKTPAALFSRCQASTYDVPAEAAKSQADPTRESTDPREVAQTS